MTYITHTVATSSSDPVVAATSLLDVDNQQQWLDDHLDDPKRRSRITALVDAFEHCDMNAFPPGMLITGLKVQDDINDIVERGKFADVHHGIYREQAVAVKRFRANLICDGVSPDKVYKRFRREALVWRQLKHPRVLAFIGVDGDNFTSTVRSIVSPWMDHGTLMQYLGSLNGATVNHTLLIMDIASGLEYLHAQAFIHGDLHGYNVFIDKHRRAVIGDFSLTFIEEMAHSATTSINKFGAVRWMSPELLNRGDENAPLKTMSGDVFSFGRLCLSVYTRRNPFHAVPQDLTVTLRFVLDNKPPPRPTAEDCYGSEMSDYLWDILIRCWTTDPEQRPLIGQVKSELGTFLELDSAEIPGTPMPRDQELMGPTRT